MNDQSFNAKLMQFFKSISKYLLIGGVVGVLVGAVNALFLKSLELVTERRIQNPWLIFFLPLAGAFVSFLYVKFGKNSSKGNNLLLEKINQEDVKVPLRMAPLVFIGTVLTHLFGGSAGREGTGVQMGGSIAVWVSKLLKLNKQDSRIILMSGVSSGFAAVFGTPLAGTVFGLEVAVLGFTSYEAIIPCFTAAYIGNTVTGLLGVSHSHYAIQNYINVSTINLLKVILAAMAFGLVSRTFSKLTHKLKELFTSSFENAMIKSFIGGIFIIALVYVVGTRDYIGLSLPLIKESMNGHVSPFAFIWKLVFTSLTLGTGFQGGEVTPLFVIGSTLGNFLGDLLKISPSHLAALGLIGVFAGATNTPIASFMLGIELFGSTGVEFLFTTCVVSYLFSGHTGIYTSQKIGRSKHPFVSIPGNATLGSMAKKKIAHVIKTDVRLAGQFKFGKSSVELPVKPGLNLFRIKTNMEGIILNHHSFNPDGAGWTSPPLAGEQRLSVSPNSDEIYAIQINEVYGKLDKVILVNSKLLSDIRVNCTIVESSSEEIVKTAKKRALNIKDDEMIIKKLSGQFKRGTSELELESEMGINKYIISVSGGTARLNHSSYNADGHFYSLPPQNGQTAHRDLSIGTHFITVDVGQSFGEKDKILIVNGSIYQAIQISYKKVNDEAFDNLNEMVD